jgi:hypothetical protein
MDKLPEKILEIARTGKLSTAVESNRAPSKALSTETVVLPCSNIDCRTNRPVEETVTRMIIRDPTVEVITGTCRCRIAPFSTDKGLPET